jgi:Na+-driven multidrug efflux pump
LNDPIYESKPIPRLILTFSVPAVLSLLVEVLTSVVDTAFAGHLGETGAAALTALGLLSPVLSLFTAIQALFAVSTAILLARHFRNKALRDRYFLTGLICTVLVSAAVSGLVFLGIGPILTALGAQGVVFALAREYLTIQLVSNVFSALGYTLTSCIRALGDPSAEMRLTAGAVAVNIAGNALFAFGFRMGFAGLAWGTLVSEICCALFSVRWVRKHGCMPSRTAVPPGHILPTVWELFRLGIAQTAIQALAGFTGLFVNRSLLLYGAADAVAVWNVAQKLYTLVLMPVVGITQGVQTIIAYFDGHGRSGRNRKTILMTIACTVIYGLMTTAAVFLLGERALGPFGLRGALLSESAAVLKLLFLTFPLVGLFYTALTVLEVTGHEIEAVLLTLTRQVFLMLPLVYLLPVLFPDLPHAVFCAVPAADVLVLLLALAGWALKGRRK